MSPFVMMALVAAIMPGQTPASDNLVRGMTKPIELLTKGNAPQFLERVLIGHNAPHVEGLSEVALDVLNFEVTYPVIYPHFHVAVVVGGKLSLPFVGGRQRELEVAREWDREDGGLDAKPNLPGRGGAAVYHDRGTAEPDVERAVLVQGWSDGDGHEGTKLHFAKLLLAGSDFLVGFDRLGDSGHVVLHSPGYPSHSQGGGSSGVSSPVGEGGLFIKSGTLLGGIVAHVVQGVTRHIGASLGLAPRQPRVEHRKPDPREAENAQRQLAQRNSEPSIGGGRFPRLYPKGLLLVVVGLIVMAVGYGVGYFSEPPEVRSKVIDIKGKRAGDDPANREP